jgi:hypothetical protein
VFSKYIVFIVYLIFLLQIQIHLSMMSFFSPLYKSAMLLCVLILVPVAFSHEKLKPVIRFSLFSFLAVAVFYEGFFNFYNYKKECISAKDRESIYRAIKSIPEDKNTAVITNSNIGPHLCCRKYIWSLDLDSVSQVFLPVIKEKINNFYVLEDLNDYTYLGRNIHPDERHLELYNLTKKFGFKSLVLYNDGIIAVTRFLK